MASTDQTVQAYIDANFPTSAVRIMRWTSDGVFNQNYVNGGDFARGFADWVTTNFGDTDATQANAIMATLAPGQE